MNYTSRPFLRGIRNEKRPLAHMYIANEIRKVKALIDDTILTVETAQRYLVLTGHLDDISRMTAIDASSELETSLDSLRNRRNDLGSYI